jgi:hypothetical protein
VNARFEIHPPREEVLEFIRSCPGATFFHSPAWLEILGESFRRFRCGWLTARAGAGLRGVMPVAVISRGPLLQCQALPFGTYGHPLAVERSDSVRLLEAFYTLGGGPRCVAAAANLLEWPGELAPPSPWHVRLEECRIISLETTFEEYRSVRMSRKRRQLCNRCEREGVSARILEPSDLDDFYRAYLSGSTHWGGVHPYPRRFFEALFRRRDEGVLVWGAYREGALIAAHVDFYFGGTAQAWQAGVTPRAHAHDAGAFLVMHAVREAISRGTATFNLGSSGGDEGMIFFKESMGGREQRYPVVERVRGWWRRLRRS